MRLYYTLTTLDPVIVSQNNASTNNHQCLDHIPGSAILGALAARHYNQLDQDQSWQAFHSGQTRFSPCYPVKNQQLCLPTPASWHFDKKKQEEAIENNRYNAAVISNHASDNFSRAQDLQYKQCRDGYTNATGEVSEIKQGLATKTALDNTTGKAKDSQLFSYAYIEAGQTFAGWIDSDNSTLLDELKLSLSGPLRIGRSRNTEFGRVKLALITAPAQPTPHNNPKSLVLWCLSDCECLSATGLPTFVPDLATLLPGATATLNTERSFIRSSRISRFNQKRQGLDSEQLLINKGSVLVFNLDQPLTDEQLNCLAQQGIGINRQQGLGWVSVNPEWAFKPNLSNGTDLFGAITVAEQTIIPTTPTQTSPLTQWVSSRLDNSSQRQQQTNTVTQLLTKIAKAYRNARQYNNILNSNEAGPSSNQWRRIATKVRNNNQDWIKGVFNGEHAICKANNDELGWGIAWDDGSRLLSFADFSNNLLSSHSVTVMRQLLEQIGRYDLSTFKGLKQCSRELNIDITTTTAAEDNQ